MGNELTFLKELANISMSVGELASVKKLIVDDIDDPAFIAILDDLLIDMVNSYQVVLTNLEPFAEIKTKEDFLNNFDQCIQRFTQRYNIDNGIPRANAEFTYEKYLEFRKLKIANTSYPILKKAFSRLHDYIDKWLDNDIWLAMSIDVVFKMCFRIMDDIAQLKKKDPDDAFSLFYSLARNIPDYLWIIENNCKLIAGETLPFTTSIDKKYPSFATAEN